MSDERFTLMFPNAIINDTIVRKSYYLSEKDDVEKLVGVLNEQQDKITELEIELTDCKNRKEQLEYKNTRLIAKIDFLERVIDGDV